MDATLVETARHGISGPAGTLVSSVSTNRASSQSTTQLPYTAKETVESDSVEITQKARQRAEGVSKKEDSTDFQRKLSITEKKQVVMKLIDPQTKNVVRQIPPEDLLRLQEAIREAAEEMDI